jgi:aspartate/methionine/tyrosine aminotransferase
MSVVWNNTTAGIPRESQLSFMAYLDLFEEKPYIQQKVRDLYALRRQRFILQLQEINKTHNFFADIGRDDGAGIYNWSTLNPNQTAFSIFKEVGLAGVPGSAFGYDDNHIRFSLGITPI